MTYRHFFKNMFAVFFVGLSVLPVINLHVDSSRVLTRDFNRHYGERANHNFLKSAWVIDNPKKYDSFIFGSSRVDVGFASNEFPDGWFKMSQPGGHPKEHLHSLILLLENGVEIKNIWLTLDDFDIYQDRDLVSDYRLRPYPRNIQEKIDFLWFYLFRRPKTFEREILKGEIKLTENHVVNGSVEQEGIELSYDSYEAHEKMVKSLNAWSWDLSQKNKADFNSTLSYVQQIKKLCDENGINLKVMMTPRHYKILYVRDYFNMAEFRRRLAIITPYWDFSALPSAYWRDNHYWLETSHFSAELGRRIKVRVNGNKTSPKYDYKFGTFVTTKNVNTLVDTSYKVLLSELPSMLKYDSNIRIDKSYLKSPVRVDVKAKVGGYSFSINDVKADSILNVAFTSLGSATLKWQCDNKLLSTTEVTELDMGETVRNFPWQQSCNQSNKLLVSTKEQIADLTASLSYIAEPVSF